MKKIWQQRGLNWVLLEAIGLFALATTVVPKGEMCG
jgi:hypothetical protein